MENVEDSVTPILDNLDVDIVVKVLSNTIFSVSHFDKGYPFL